MKDHSYAVLFDKKKDYQFLLKYAEKVRLTHNQNLVDNFNNACQRKLNDHNNVYVNDMEILAVSKSDDLVVSAGTSFLIDQILRTTSTRWTYVAVGTGTTAVSSAQTTLVTETGTRVNMSLFGWREFANASLRFAGIFGESAFGVVTIKECGIFTASSGGTMLNRNMFSNAPLNTTGAFAFVISSVIEFVPIV